MDPEQKSSWKTWAGLAAFLVFFATASCVIMLMPDGNTTSVPGFKLPDGRTIRLEAVTYGKKHELHTRSRFVEMLQDILPRGLRNVLGLRARVKRSTYTEEMLCPWLSVDVAPGGGFPNYDDLRIVADTGEEFEINSRSGGDLIDGRRLMRWNVRAFPRRQKEFKLVGKLDKQEFELTLKNPLWPLSVTEWSADRIPVSTNLESFMLTLQSGQLRPWRGQASFNPVFDVTEKDVSRKDWFEFTWDLSDATGNSGYHLSTNEPVWRVNVRAYRAAGARWATNEYHQFTLTNMPATGEIQEYPLDITIQGKELRSLWVGGPGHYEISNNVVTLNEPYDPSMGSGFSSSSSGSGASGNHWIVEWKRNKHWILIDSPYRPGDQRLSVFATDAKGNGAKVKSSGSTGASAFYAHFFELEKFEDGNEYTIRLAPQEPLRAEFFIAPRDLPVNEPNPKR